MSPNIYLESWSGFSETRDVWPFAKADSALQSCAIRVVPNNDFSSDETIQLSENPLNDGSGFMPEVRVSIDKEILARESELPLDGIALCISLADHATKRAYTIARRPVDQFEDGALVRLADDLTGQLSGLRGFTVTITAVSLLSNGAYDLGDRIAEKEFKLGVPGEAGFSFPIGKLDPDSDEWPVDRYPKTTAWFIKWGPAAKVFDFNSDTQEVLEVVFNEKVYNSLFHLQKKTDASHKLFWSTLCIDIFLEVAAVYLTADEYPEPDDKEDGFRARFVRSLQSHWSAVNGGKKVGYQQLASMFKNECDFISRLRASLQDKFGVTRIAERVKTGDA